MVDSADARDDESILDLVFERAVEAPGSGPRIGIDDLLVGREHLRPAAEDLIRRARSLRRSVVPEFAPAEIEGYEIVRELGRGAMGTVFLARSRRLEGRPVALKVLPRAARLSERGRERFRLEASTLSRLRHPNVVGILDVLREPELDAYAMEWVEGMSLAELIRELARGGRPPDLASAGRILDPDRAKPWEGSFVGFACRLGIMLARALAEVHRAGLLHRDVKPSNVLLRRDGTPVLSDFGLARDSETPLDTQTGRFLGTLAYAAPEQLRGDHQRVGPGSDVYSLGVTLYHLLALELPFPRGPITEVLEAAARADRIPLRARNRGCPADLGTVVEKAMAPDPEDRYASADGFADDLERVVRLEPILARRSGPLVRASRFLCRHRRVLHGALSGAVAVLLLVIPLALSSSSGREARQRARELRQEAQLLLLEPWLHDRIHQGYEPRPASAGAAPRATLGDYGQTWTEALRLYDRAASLAPDDPDLLLERRVLALAEAVRTRSGDTAGLLAALGGSAPLLRKLVASWTFAAPPPEITDEDLAASAPADRRAGGLFAALCFEPTLALRIFGSRPVDAHPDVLADGLQGEMWMARARPDLAWPRLIKAFEAAPRSRYLGSLVADAAVRLGDLDAAELLVERLPSLEGPDPFETSVRVRADFLRVRGRLHEARVLYEDLRRRHGGPDLHHGYAQVLEGLGEKSRAVLALLDWADASARLPQPKVEALRAAARWWEEAGPSVRWRALRAAFEAPSTPERPSSAAAADWALLQRLRNVLHSWRRSPPAAAPAAENPSGNATLEDPLSSQDLEGTRLFRLLLDEEVFAMLQCDSIESPAILKDAAVLVALTPPLRKAVPILPVLMMVVLGASREAGAQSELWTFDGSQANGQLGLEVDSVGDIDGDGFDDIISGEPTAIVSGVGAAGQVRVWSGRTGAVLRVIFGNTAGDWFGAAVSGIGDLDGDAVPDLLIGARQIGTGPGYARVVSGATGGTIATAMGAGFGDQFGASLDAIDDVDGDGVADYIAGTFEYQPSGPGYARVFSGATGTMIYQVNGLATGDLFGVDVAGIGDVTGDAVPDFLVGAYQLSAPKSGYAQVFSGSDGALLRTHHGGVPSRFGIRVAGVGDIDQDTIPDYCVSGDGFQNFTGRVVAFSGATGTQLWQATGNSAGEVFGSGLCGAHSDWNGDGILEVVVGAEQTLITGGRGYVRVLDGVSGTALFTFHGDSAGDRLGIGLGPAGDVNADGIADIVAGAVGDDTNGRIDSGSVRIYSPVTVHAPVASAGADQSVPESAMVTLDGSGSSISWGRNPGYEWTQVAGVPALLSLAGTAHPQFVAPLVPAGGGILTFQLVVQDGRLDQSPPDVVNITVTNVNNRPVAIAGPDQTVAEGSPVTLDGTGSYDPDDENLTFTWSQTGGPVVSLDVTDPRHPVFFAPLVGPAGGSVSFELTVSDGLDVATDSVSVVVDNVNHAPTADAGPDQTVLEGSPVALEASGSQDPDADVLTHSWLQLSGPFVALSNSETATPGFTAPLVGVGGATLVFRVTVDDGYGGTASDEVQITVQDGNSPPACGLARPSVDELWPPNHKLIPVSITGVSDPENSQITITILGVTQDEPTTGLEIGDIGPDAVLQGGTVLLRAERAGGGNGRIYRVSFQATDGFGGTCTGVVEVCVPPRKKVKNAPPCVDDGQIFDSLGS